MRGDRALLGIKRGARDRAQRFGMPLRVERPRGLLVGNTIAAKQISIPDEPTCADAIKRLRAATRAEPEKHPRPQKPRAFRIREAS